MNYKDYLCALNSSAKECRYCRREIPSGLGERICNSRTAVKTEDEEYEYEAGIWHSDTQLTILGEDNETYLGDFEYSPAKAKKICKILESLLEIIESFEKAKGK